MLAHAQEILAADTRLQQLSVRLAAPVEARLTVVFSDVYQLDPEQRVLQRFAEAFPEIELEWLDAEGEDVLELVGSGRAALGLLPRRKATRTVWWHGRWPITANCRCMWRATMRWPTPAVAQLPSWHGTGRCD